MLKINVLGCGSSLGVPVIGCNCSVCKSSSRYNKRLRPSIIINLNKTKILVDFGFNIKEQLINSRTCYLDGAILTHEHADHVSGIDELKVFFYIHGKPLRIFVLESIAQLILKKYQYLFDNGMLKIHIVNEFQKVEINDVFFQLFPQVHGTINTLGIKVENFVYSCDISSIPLESEKYFYNLKVWIVDCINYKSTTKHAGLEKVLEWDRKYKPQKIYLTNMSHSIDYHKIINELPFHIKPLYDNFEIYF